MPSKDEIISKDVQPSHGHGTASSRSKMSSIFLCNEKLGQEACKHLEMKNLHFVSNLYPCQEEALDFVSNEGTKRLETKLVAIAKEVETKQAHLECLVLCSILRISWKEGEDRVMRDECMSHRRHMFFRSLVSEWNPNILQKEEWMMKDDVIQRKEIVLDVVPSRQKQRKKERIACMRCSLSSMKTNGTDIGAMYDSVCFTKTKKDCKPSIPELHESIRCCLSHAILALLSTSSFIFFF